MLEPQTLEGSALVTKNEQTQPQKRGKIDLIRVLGRDNKDNLWKDNKDNLWCTYYNPRHIEEHYWKLNARDRRNEVFIVKRLKDLRGLLGSFDKPSDACSLALSGAIDMSHTSQYFCTYTPCPSSRKIMVANGSLATVARLEDVYVTPSLILKNVLHVYSRKTTVPDLIQVPNDVPSPANENMNVFLHEDLEEEICISIPPGFEGEETINKVQSQGDHTLFIKHSTTGGVITFLVYVDDIIVTENDKKEKQDLKQCLIKEFEIKELRRLKYFLGIEVSYSRQEIFISQQKETHLQAAYCVLHYLNGSPGKGVLFERNNALTLEAYRGANYVDSSVDRKSMFGYCMFLGENLLWVERESGNIKKILWGGLRRKVTKAWGARKKKEAFTRKEGVLEQRTFPILILRVRDREKNREFIVGFSGFGEEEEQKPYWNFTYRCSCWWYGVIKSMAVLDSETKGYDMLKFRGAISCLLKKRKMLRKGNFSCWRRKQKLRSLIYIYSTQSFYLMLNEFYKNLRSVGASTVSGAEMEEFFKVTEPRSLIQKLCLVPLLVTQYALYPSSYGLYQSSIQILETESERESDASNAWSCSRAMDHKVLLSLVPIHTVILPFQLPTEFLEPFLEKKWVVGFDCEGVDLCHHGTQFIHGADPSVKSKTLSYDLITYMQLLDNEPVETQSLKSTDSEIATQLRNLSNEVEKGSFDGKLIISSNSNVKDVDSDDKDPFYVTSMPVKSIAPEYLTMDKFVLSFNLHRPSCVHLAFVKALRALLWPDSWSYILHTHNHMGLINEEHRFFVSMTRDYGMMPHIECLCLLLK
ncbi:hypothetical protein AAG906_014273 [Vitis piasezkii]